MHGGTQNQNESFTSLIWQRAIKETHSSLPTIQLATYLAIGYCNEGAQTFYNVLAALGLYLVGFLRILQSKVTKNGSTIPQLQAVRRPRKDKETSETRKKDTVRHS